MRAHRMLGLALLLLGLTTLVGAVVLHVELGSPASSGKLELSAYAEFMVESVVVPLRRGWSRLVGGPAPGPAQFAGAVRGFSLLMGLVGAALVGAGAWLLARSSGSSGCSPG